MMEANIDRKTKRRLIKTWDRYLRAGESMKNQFTNHTFEFIIDDVGFGWEYVRFILDGSTEKSCRISYIGPSVKDYVICIMTIASDETRTFTWYDEPSYITYDWLFSRQGDILYVEAPDIPKGFFIKYEDFTHSIRKGYEDMYKWETVSKEI